MLKIALYGKPGAGKSTFARLLTQHLQARDTPCAVVKIGAPLYELQALLYTIAWRPLLEPTAQDGLLLADLAGHLRRINPSSLTDLFAAKMATAPAGAALVCDDMRAPDVEAVKKLGFMLVEIQAPQQVRQARKHARGDLASGSEEHPTEAPVGCAPDYQVVNDGDVAALRGQAAALIEWLEVPL